ncbi:MAG: hypothetical protein L0G99_07195 [Propionibacteriales bacterium]|nr:hypothetical protein [Propionibacteriales bacterium]
MLLLEVDPNLVVAGWVPLIILILMFVAVYFLYRNMRKHVSRIDSNLPSAEDVRLGRVPVGYEASARDASGQQRAAAVSPKSPDV